MPLCHPGVSIPIFQKRSSVHTPTSSDVDTEADASTDPGCAMESETAWMEVMKLMNYVVGVL